MWPSPHQQPQPQYCSPGAMSPLLLPQQQQMQQQQQQSGPRSQNPGTSAPMGSLQAQVRPSSSSCLFIFEFATSLVFQVRVALSKSHLPLHDRLATVTKLLSGIRDMHGHAGQANR